MTRLLNKYKKPLLFVLSLVPIALCLCVIKKQ